MHCWNCAHVVNDGEKKCPSCGVSRKIEKGTKIHYCPNCGKGIWEKEKCKYCGFDVILKRVVQEAEAVDEKKTASTVRASVKASDDLNVDKQVPPQNVKNKTSDDSKKEAILKKLQQQDSVVQNQVLKRLEDAKTKEISEKTADFFLSLPALEKMNPKIQQEARFVLSARYPDFVKNECWKICVDIMQIVYFPCLSNFTDAQTWDTYCKFRDLYGVLQDHILEKRMFEMMSQEMKRVSSNEEQIQLFCQCFFDAKNSSSLLLIQNHPEVFGIFFQVLNFLQSGFQKYSEEQWGKYYNYVLENKCNIKNIVQCIFNVFLSKSLDERIQKIYDLLSIICNKFSSHINIVASTEMIYTEILYYDYLLQSENLGSSRWKSDVESLVFQNSRGVPVLSNLQKIAADEIEKEPRLSQVFPVAYCELWKAVLATPLNRCSVDEIVHQVKMAESFLTDYPRKEEVLAEIHRVAFEQLPVERLQNANEESIAYLYANYRNAGFLHSKISTYYEVDQLLVSYDDFPKIRDAWAKFNNILNYYQERLKRRRQTLCSKRNPSELEKQTLVFLVLHQIKSYNYMFSRFWNLLAVNQNALISNRNKHSYLCYSILFCQYIDDINLQNTCARFFTNEMCRCIEDGDVRQHLKNAEFKKLYQDIKNTYFWYRDEEKKEDIYQAAKNTGDVDLMEIFRVRKSTSNVASTRKEQSKPHHKAISICVLIAILVIISVLLIFMFKYVLVRMLPFVASLIVFIVGGLFPVLFGKKK